MTEQFHLHTKEWQAANSAESFAEPLGAFVDVPAFEALGWTQVESESQLAVSTPTCVQIDLEELECFQAVDSQFEELGITFSNAIALQPSNPAFPPHAGNTVLMGAPKPGFLEAIFHQPVRFVRGFVTSSRPATLAAYDREGNLLTSTELPTGNLAGSSSEIAPNAQLSISAADIHRITFYAFNGQLTLDGFGFSF